MVVKMGVDIREIGNLPYILPHLNVDQYKSYECEDGYNDEAR